MKDSLKNFINTHRDAFDEKQPSEKVWSNIERNVFKQHTPLWSNIQLWRAAAVLFLTLSVFLFVSTRYPSAPSDKAKLQVEFNDLEKFYNGQIADKVELINHIQELNEEESFVQDLEKLDAMYQVLREQMKSNPSEKIKDALILNMLVRIDLLNQQIKSLEESEKKPVDVTI